MLGFLAKSFEGLSLWGWGICLTPTAIERERDRNRGGERAEWDFREIGSDGISCFYMGLFTIKPSSLFSSRCSTPFSLSLIFLSPLCNRPPPHPSTHLRSPPPSFTMFVSIWRMSPSRPCRPHISAGRSWDVTGCDFSLSSLYHLRDLSATWLQCRWTARHRSPRCNSSPRAITRIKTIPATYDWLWRVHMNWSSSYRICAF